MIVERPGYLGKKRDEVYSLWDEQHGEGNWQLAYTWDGAIVPRDFALQIYEDAWYELFKKDEEVCGWLSRYKDVYDTAPSNVESGFDYSIQETPNNHIHDIAIRRAFVRSGHRFEGDKLLHVRWKDTEGFRLNPGMIPFHLSDLIEQAEVKDYGNKGEWWHKNTPEEFYQRNKVLIVRTS